MDLCLSPDFSAALSRPHRATSTSECKKAMRSTRLYALISLSGIVSTGPFSSAHSQEEFRSDVEKTQLIDHAGSRWGSVNRWLIEYEGVPATTNTRSSIVHKIMAVSAPDSFYHMSAHSPNHPWQVDPFCQEFFIYGGQTRHRWPFNRAYSEEAISIGGPIPGSTWKDVLLAIIPAWPFTSYRMPNGSHTVSVLIEALQSQKYRVLAKVETISGEDCAVFDDGGIERIWIATNKGLCLMRRDTYDPQTHRLIERIVTDRIAEIAPALWLPMEYRLQIFQKVARRKEDTIERESRIRIIRCLLNDAVPEATFKPIHRLGSIKFDAGRSFVQTYPGGEDLLDQIVDFVTRYKGLPTKSLHAPRSLNSFAWLFAGLIVGFCASACFALVQKTPAAVFGKGERRGDSPVAKDELKPDG